MVMVTRSRRRAGGPAAAASRFTGGTAASRAAAQLWLSTSAWSLLLTPAAHSWLAPGRVAAA